MRKVELGVFMPVGSNGFLMSKRTPRYHPTFELHRSIAEIAEDIGLDYLFWMGKWMGFGGATGFWEETIEPMSMASAIAPLTSRLKLFTTINPLLFHPAVAAKLIATIDNISGGRFGINVVTGNTLEELEQMGVVPEGYGDYRYEYADEWLSVMKMLWTQERTSYQGRFFKLDNCVSAPKPLGKPYPKIVSAGLSGDGMAFAAKHSDYQFVGLRAEDVKRMRQAAADQGREVRVVTSMMLLHGESDAAAQKEFDLIREELDTDALDNLIRSFERDNRDSYKDRTSYLRQPNTVGFGSGTPVVGSPDTMAEKLCQMIVESGIDGIQFTFVDYVKDLKFFGAVVLPKLQALLARHDIVVADAPATKAVAA
ncbi:MAG TPA: LLM class flavin-dependent oxidoreductase [Rhizobiaceae bacterium]|nr:LLM class flavin-dependent oxidoreductase [Rhizobiaceae bacterium]